MTKIPTESLDVSVTISRIDVVIKRHIIDTPVKTSFGTMTERPAIFVRIMDENGSVGYGEIWCNFPACGADHRARMLTTEISPRAIGRHFKSPKDAFDFLSEATHILALQSGEFGPLAQCISGLDVAIWDLVSKRHGIALHKLLASSTGIASTDTINVYASGINPKGVSGVVERLQGLGHSRFKLKVGFGNELDLANLKDAQSQLSHNQDLMVDANQAWDINSALEALPPILEFNPKWIEEPLRKDAPVIAWEAFKQACSTNVAGGENFMNLMEFKKAADSDWMDIFQPDVCKWGGVTKSFEVAQYVHSVGKIMCPHSLGGGIALAASAHVLAACGADAPGLLEIDSNINPLREDVFPVAVSQGQIVMPDLPGLGVDTGVLDAYFNNPD